jgi:uncharacterized protein DUF3105
MGGNRFPAALLAAVLLPACGGPGGSHHESPVPTDPGIETFPSEGQTHVPEGTVIVYGTDPPTSGPHYPVPQSGGFFDHEIAAGYLVHSMEHGGVIIYYNPATVTKDQKDDLRRLAKAHPGTFDMVICVPRNDPTYPIILTAWTHRLRLTTYDQARIDGFVTLFLGHGPEHDPM